MRTSILFFLWIVVCVLGQAQSSGSVGGGSEKCLCKGKLLNTSRHKPIQFEPVVYPKTIFCMKIEIIVTLKAGMQRCLDPNSWHGRRIISRFIHGNQGQTKKQRRAKTNKRRRQKQKTRSSHV
uniref:Chemokine ligand 10 n=1 Tax=Plecoglossus altivelis TaxID=61084 RepID=A0A1B0Z5A9_PLEAT|nr:chemokine ligand 10 [Plecoglossus altivelis]